jgi:hypothetical protein
MQPPEALDEPSQVLVSHADVLGNLLLQLGGQVQESLDQVTIHKAVRIRRLLHGIAEGPILAERDAARGMHVLGELLLQRDQEILAVGCNHGEQVDGALDLGKSLAGEVGRWVVSEVSLPLQGMRVG